MEGERRERNGDHTNRFGFAEPPLDAPSDAEAEAAAGLNRAEPAGRSTFERRLREGADAFEFDTLINGPASNAESMMPDGTEAAMDVRNDQDGPPPRAASTGRAIVRTGRGQANPSPVDEPMISPAPLPDGAHAARSGAGRLVGVVLSVIVAAVVAAAVIGAIAFRIGESATGRDGTVQAAARRPRSAQAGAPALAADAPASRKGLPNPALTPGDFAPGGDRSQRVPAAARQAVLRAYHIPPDDTRYVVIRLVPLVFDGTNRPANLFPTTPWFAGLKARLDKKLEQLVRQGTLTTAQARQELTSDWLRSAHKHFVRNYGLNSGDAARQEEESLHWY